MTVFVTNIWNHYTTTIGKPMADILGGENFRLALVSPTKEDPLFTRKAKMKWSFDLPNEKWLVPNPETSKELANGEAVRLIETADVAVIDSLYANKRLFKAVSMRIRAGKLTFFSNERYFKRAITIKDCVNPINCYRWMKMHWRFSHPNVHYLPMSHFGVDDMRFYDACKGRIWKWGYFPEVSEAPIDKPDREKLHVGWAGRMIDWKHVEYIIHAAALLDDDSRARCKVELVGDGPQKQMLVDLTKHLGLQDVITFRGYLSVSETMEFMRNLDVYVLPSDRGEGWGVVLAEAMDKCCVPISCVEAGATLELIDDGENGFVFEKGDAKRIASKIRWLLNNPEQRRDMGRKAWRTMQKRSPKIAAERLVQLIGAIRDNRPELIPEEGLCSHGDLI